MKRFDFSKLAGKVCVITGGAGVIGVALCEALASVGIHVAIIDLNRENADAIATQISEKYHTKCMGVKANVLDKASLQNAKDLIHERLGKIDFLINAAGGNAPEATTKIEQITENDLDKLETSFFGLEPEAFDKVFDLNFKGTLLSTMVFAEEMVKNRQGVIINISSMNSFRPLTKIPAYSAAKASINNFTQWLAVHLAKSGVRVNTIAPGFFLTNQNRFLLTDKETGEATARGIKIIGNTPMGKYGDPEDLQGTLLFLLSELSSFITGVIIPVDGGYSAYGGV
jgi:NAD(P)-dependent dehydrogenase (short-subunit alcohol dehydrogenase family)